MEQNPSSNSVVCLPTGAGKTLVAAKLIAGTVVAQPTHLTLFLVERISLVAQQRRVIAEQTKLAIGAYSGETPVKEWGVVVVSRDCCIVTTGLLLNQLGERRVFTLDEGSLVFMDEAHHCGMSHPFAEVLHLHYYTLPPAAAQPRLFGMTASPGASASGVTEGPEELARGVLDLCWHMDEARLLVPIQPENRRELEDHLSPPDAEIVPVALPPAERQLA
ncbi:unnamed protein product, partial [Phaeothamnion confervicola]